MMFKNCISCIIISIASFIQEMPILWAFLINIIAASFLNFKQQMENMSQQIAKQFETLFQQQSCEDIKEALYLKQCSGIISQTCFQDFPVHNDCYVKGVKLSQSIGYRAPKKKFQFMSCSQIKFMKATYECQHMFENIVNPSRNRRFSKVYIASNSGLFASHPSSTGQECADYDPRIRPWFTAASTASKNTIIAFKTKIFSKRASQIGANLIKTMNIGDWSLIIDLNNCSSSECFPVYKSTTLQRNLSLLTIENSPSEWSAKDYTLLKQKAKQFFEFVNNSTMNVVVIVTDQYIESSSLGDALNDISSYQPKLIPIIIGNHQNSELRSLACNYSGLLIEDKREHEAIDVLRPYAEYFSEGIDLNKARWSTLYDDIFGFGSLATVTYPIKENNKLIGVVGIDVAESYIQQEFGLQSFESQAELVSLQIYGSVDRSHFCNYEVTFEENIDVSRSWTSGETETVGICCIPSEQLTLIVTIVPVSVALLIGLIVVFCRKLCRWIVVSKYKDQKSGSSDEELKSQ